MSAIIRAASSSVGGGGSARPPYPANRASGTRPTQHSSASRYFSLPNMSWVMV